MAEKYLVSPDVDFIKQVQAQGGGDLKKCFQCATCSVVCPISPDNQPFPRKEMVAASWGLKDNLINDMDIWLCHQCGDCSTMCPRGAHPGDVLAAVRSAAITEYARPKALAEAVNDPKKFPILVAIPAVIFFVLALITTKGGDFMIGLFGEEFWTHGVDRDIIAASNFISTWFVDLVFVPLSIFMVAAFALSLSRFIKDMHADALRTGKTDKTTINPKEFIQALIRIIPDILKHRKFSECSENRERATTHMMVFFSFIALAVVTGIFFVALYIFHLPGPYSQLNPVKILANIAGISLVIGGFMMIVHRRSKQDQVSTFKDWYLVGLVLGLGLTGMLTQMARLGDIAWLSYGVYYLHLILVFHLFAFLPYSKLAHIVYRTCALGYAEYIGRK